MRRLKLTSDIKPVSEFRANAAELIEQVRNTGRPLVLTQRGHSAAVVLDVEEYEHLLEEIELLRDIRVAEKELKTGKSVPNREAKRKIKERLNG
ncbi:MAG: type II toxin-antitoxin system Phd/YefM family antitoxin [Thermoanaerobaculia bacterium]|nr:type II toxin-antitoxin system Phd/YefM family antitoxin [Thermoanaerobaculia bacterium]